MSRLVTDTNIDTARLVTNLIKVADRTNNGKNEDTASISNG